MEALNRDTAYGPAFFATALSATLLFVISAIVLGAAIARTHPRLRWHGVAYAVLLPLYAVTGFTFQAAQPIAGFALAATTTALALRLPQVFADANPNRTAAHDHRRRRPRQLGRTSRMGGPASTHRVPRPVVGFPAAMTVTWAADGRHGVRRLLHRMVRWRVGVGWWLVALAGLPVLTVGFALLLGDSVRSIDPVDLFVSQLGFLAVNFILVNIWEETAWAGFLQTDWSGATTSSLPPSSPRSRSGSCTGRWPSSATSPPPRSPGRWPSTSPSG
jgi:hypothetical protein